VGVGGAAVTGALVVGVAVAELRLVAVADRVSSAVDDGFAVLVGGAVPVAVRDRVGIAVGGTLLLVAVADGGLVVAVGAGGKADDAVDDGIVVPILGAVPVGVFIAGFDCVGVLVNGASVTVAVDVLDGVGAVIVMGPLVT